MRAPETHHDIRESPASVIIDHPDRGGTVLTRRCNP